MHQYIIHCAVLDEQQLRLVEESFSTQPVLKNNYFLMSTETDNQGIDLPYLRKQLGVDINHVPKSFDGSRLKLLVSDMDSTLISIECVDEIADFLNIKPQVAAITESAMRGEIDFPTSLKKRVALLADLDSTALQKVYDERLTLNSGAESLIEGLKAQGIKFALVSGGFTYFTDRLQKRLDLDYVLSNQLDIMNDKLTGRVVGDIIDADAKREFLLSLCQQLNISPDQTIAMGDGANDLKMMHVAGLGVAYHAKPTVQQQADIVLNYRGLDAVLDLLTVNE